MKEGSDFALEIDARQNTEGAVFETRLDIEEAAALLRLGQFDVPRCAVICQYAFSVGMATLVGMAAEMPEAFAELVERELAVSDVTKVRTSALNS